MKDVLLGFLTIWLIIGVGWTLARFRKIDVEGQFVLSQVAFLVGLPASMFTSLRKAQLARILSLNVLVSALAIVITVLIYLIFATVVWHSSLGHKVIGAFSTSYVNAVNMGVPIASYVLKDTSWVAPILLLQVIFLQPLGLMILDELTAAKHGYKASKWRNLTLPFRNPMTIGAVAGIAVNLTGAALPDLVLSTVEVLSGITVPAMLISFGVALCKGPLPGAGNMAETVVVSILKVFVLPLVAWALARFCFHLDSETTLAVTVMAGLPTAQNVFVFATRGEESMQLARDAIFISSLASIPAVTGLAVLVHAV